MVKKLNWRELADIWIEQAENERVSQSAATYKVLVALFWLLAAIYERMEER
jgi:thiamine kinase-like enzyme